MGKISESYKEEIEQIFGEIYEDFIKKKLLDSIHIFILKESEKIKNDFVQFILDFAQNWDHKVLKMIESTLSEEIDPIKTSIEEHSKNIFSGVNRLEKIVMGHKKEIEDEISRNRSECMEKLYNVSELLTDKTNDLSAQMSSLDIKLADLDTKLISMGEGLNETLIQNRRYFENQMQKVLKMIESTLSEEIDPIKTSIEENSKNIFSGMNRLEKIVMESKKEIKDEISQNHSECIEKLHNISELLTSETNNLSTQMSSLDIRLTDLDTKLISMGKSLNETLTQNRRYFENQMPNIQNSYKRLQKILNILTPLVILSFILNILTLILIMVKFF